MANFPIRILHLKQIKNSTSGTDSTNLIGDINNDGTINILDVVILVDLIKNYLTYEEKQLACETNGWDFEAADLNVDNNINVLDVVMLVNIILTGG